MAKNNDTKITLNVKGEDIVTAKMLSQEPLETIEFMELVESFIANAPFDIHQMESYIMEWGKEIKAKREN